MYLHICPCMCISVCVCVCVKIGGIGFSDKGSKNGKKQKHEESR